MRKEWYKNPPTLSIQGGKISRVFKSLFLFLSFKMKKSLFQMMQRAQSFSVRNDTQKN